MVIQSCTGMMILLLLTSCGFSDSRDEAAEVMNRYFAAIEVQDYTVAMDLYADAFFRDTSRDAWEAQLRSYRRLLGDLESFEAISWNVKKNVGVKAGTFVRVVYRTRYSRHPAMEQFILKKADEGFRIISHRLDAEKAPGGKTQFV